MKTKTKLVFVLVMIATLIISLAVYAFAKTNTQDGLEGTIITDKKSYSYSDDVVVKISVKNTNERIVKNVSIEGMIPEGLKLKEGNSLENQITELQPGETLDLTFVAVLDKKKQLIKIQQIQMKQIKQLIMRPLIRMLPHLRKILPSQKMKLLQLRRKQQAKKRPEQQLLMMLRIPQGTMVIIQTIILKIKRFQTQGLRDFPQSYL